MENFNICQHDEFCGGCIYQGVPYEEQLAVKEAEVKNIFAEKDIHPDIFDGIEGCSEEHRYRYRMGRFAWVCIRRKISCQLSR